MGMIGYEYINPMPQDPITPAAKASKDDLLQVQLLSHLGGATDAPAHAPWTKLLSRSETSHVTWRY